MTILRNILLLFGFGLLSFNSHAQLSKLPWKTIYIVRHAEKEKGPDPVLTVEGKQRAGDLYRLLIKKKIDIIFSTPYRRTRMTGDSLRIYAHTDTASYKADTTGMGLEDAMMHYTGKQKNVLIIAHSNTIGAILRKLGAAGYEFKDLGDNDYDNLYIVSRKGNRIQLKQQKFGRASVNQTPGKMQPLQ